MTAERRLERIETALSPTERVLRWLAEAHAYGDFESYVRSLLDRRPDELPLERLIDATARGVRAERRGQRPEVVGLAIHTSLRETVFRYQLVLRINEVAHETLEREGLIGMILAARLALPQPHDGQLDSDSVAEERLTDLLALAARRAGDLAAMEEARAIVERRYLAGSPSLFPALAQAWQEQRERNEALVALADGLAAACGVVPAQRLAPHLDQERVATFVADLVEPAKAIALEELGDGHQAHRVATEWVRGKLAPPS